MATERWPNVATIMKAQQALERGDYVALTRRSNSRGTGLPRVVAFFGLSLPIARTASHGLREHGATIQWATRRETFGPSGMRDEVVAKRAKQMRAINQRKRQLRTCRRGHRWTVENTVTYPSKPGVRYCRACQQVREGRRRWVASVERPRLASLKQAMLDAHPDRGGTSLKFMDARRRYLRALKVA